MQYARSYYRKLSKLHGSYFQPRGWDFPGDDEPDYKDFLYFSFGIRMTCRGVADVQITSRSTRYIVLFHCVLSFFFNTAILAMSVNIIAGLTWDDFVADAAIFC